MRIFSITFGDLQAIVIGPYTTEEAVAQTRFARCSDVDVEEITVPWIIYRELDASGD